MTGKRNIKDIEQALRDLAVDFDGRTKIVRVVDAARLIGMSRQSIYSWINHGTARSVRLTCKPRRKASIGVILCVYLDDVLKHFHAPFTYARWTDQQFDLLLELLSECKSIKEIAEATGKTQHAVKHKIRVTDIDIAAVADFYTVKQLSDFLAVPAHRINGWVQQSGLKVRRHDAFPTMRLFDLNDLVKFIRKHPWVWLDDVKREILSHRTGKPVPVRSYFKRGAA